MGWWLSVCVCVCACGCACVSTRLLSSCHVLEVLNEAVNIMQLKYNVYTCTCVHVRYVQYPWHHTTEHVYKGNVPNVHVCVKIELVHIVYMYLL